MQGDKSRHMGIEASIQKFSMALTCMEEAPSGEQQRKPHWHICTGVCMLPHILDIKHFSWSKIQHWRVELGVKNRNLKKTFISHFSSVLQNGDSCQIRLTQKKKKKELCMLYFEG